VNVSSFVPPPVTGSFTPDLALRRRLASAQITKPAA
jgi:hypothetical protein